MVTGAGLPAANSQRSSCQVRLPRPSAEVASPEPAAKAEWPWGAVRGRGPDSPVRPSLRARAPCQVRAAVPSRPSAGARA